jgi:protein arginine kinase activator
MLCERCGIREANIRYTEIRNGVKTEHNYCSVCARELNFGPYSALIDGDFPLGKILSGLLGQPAATGQEDELSEISCPTCGTTYREFIDNSCFGCADCYHVFDPLIGEKIRKLQDSGTHTGKVPKMRPAAGSTSTVNQSGDLAFPTEEKIRQLNRQMQDAVKREDYEKAAECRDQINALKKNEGPGAEPDNGSSPKDGGMSGEKGAHAEGGDDDGKVV